MCYAELFFGWNNSQADESNFGHDLVKVIELTVDSVFILSEKTNKVSHLNLKFFISVISMWMAAKKHQLYQATEVSWFFVWDNWEFKI